jgi:hypothetical protein
MGLYQGNYSLTLVTWLSHHVSMATKTTTKLVDDLDGSSTASRTVPFSIEGTRYEIDLTEKHADQLRKALDPFVEKARRLGRGKSASATTSRRATSGRKRSPRKKANNDEIRAWARKNGVEVADRGRIPNSVMEQYNAATSSS